MGKVVEVHHPLVNHHVPCLRDQDASSEVFRHSVRRLAALLTYEATRDLETKVVPVTTPLTETHGEVIRDRIGLVPILRAGLGMVNPVLDLIPTAEVWHLGVYRDETTLQPVEYYRKFPKTDPVDFAFVIDPMLATGGSSIAALESVRQWGVPKSRLLSLIAAPEGLDAVQKAFQDVDIYICAIDEKLSETAYILPGLGDAGNRIFNT